VNVKAHKEWEEKPFGGLFVCEQFWVYFDVLIGE